MSRVAAAKSQRPAWGRRSRSKAAPSARSLAQNKLNAYLKGSERPLQSLFFVLPLILIYEIGWRLAGSHLLAFNLIHQCFSMLGAPGTFLPAAALIGILLAWHIACGDKWTVDIGVILGMYLESLLLTIPIFLMAAAMARWELAPLRSGSGNGFVEKIIISMGAGIYEEMILRLVLLTLLTLLLIDLLKIEKTKASLLMVLTSGIAFSLYHYLGAESFSWTTCLFRTIAGIYFAAIFICRGFGVTAGSHAIYDIILTALAPLG
jgi:membrane protease YdiL (CAAX protease family)